MNKIKKIQLLTILTLTLSACGGDDSPSSPIPPVVPPTTVPPTTNPDGNSATSFAMGFIESIDRVRRTVNVNGSDYRVDQIIYGGEPFDFERLEIDMQVKTAPKKMLHQADLHNQEAMVDLKLSPSFTGTIENINRNQKRFTVNGVPFIFKSLSEALTNGDSVMLSSIPKPDGTFEVKSVVRVDINDLLGLMEMEGRITNLDTTRRIFDLNGVKVDYSNASVEGALTLREGMWVEVEGIMQGKTFFAREVDVDSFDIFDNWPGHYDIEGMISWVAQDKSSFELSHRGRFLVTPTTRFKDGTKQMLTIGRHVEVNAYNKGGQGYAQEVEFEDGFDLDDLWEGFEFECEGVARNLNNNTFEINCPIMPKTIYIDARTHFEDIYPSQINNRRIEVEGVILNQKYFAREIEPADFDWD